MLNDTQVNGISAQANGGENGAVSAPVITEKELTDQIAALLPDFFVTELSRAGDRTIKMSFSSGEAFLVSIEKQK